jgi:hypothetical protein
MVTYQVDFNQVDFRGHVLIKLSSSYGRSDHEVRGGSTQRARGLKLPYLAKINGYLLNPSIF